MKRQLGLICLVELVLSMLWIGASPAFSVQPPFAGIPTVDLTFDIGGSQPSWSLVSQDSTHAQYNWNNYTLNLTLSTNGDQQMVGYTLTPPNGQSLSVNNYIASVTTPVGGLDSVMVPGQRKINDLIGFYDTYHYWPDGVTLYLTKVPNSFQEAEDVMHEEPYVLVTDSRGDNAFSVGWLKAGNVGGASGAAAASNYVITLNRQNDIPFTGSSLSDSLVFNLAKKPWFDVERTYAQQFDSYNGRSHAAAPSWWWNPTYDTWYCYLDSITQSQLLSVAQIANSLGMPTILLDAGWSTPSGGDWGNFQTGHIGDFTAYTPKFPDLAGAVSTMHGWGMKVQLWHPPLWQGKQSQAYINTCSTWHAYTTTDGEWFCMCPRYSGVEQWLYDNYRTLTQTYDIDGTWVDFAANLPYICQSGHTHRSESMPDSWMRCMEAIGNGMKSVKSDACIEARCMHANLDAKIAWDRVQPGDAPRSYEILRLANIHIRPWAYDVVFKNDPMIWPSDADNATVGKFLATDVCNGVPCLSIDLINAPQWQKDDIGGWMSFYNSHRSTLTTSDFHLFGADYGIPDMAMLGSGEAVVYAKNSSTSEVPMLPRTLTNIYVLNCTTSDTMALKLPVMTGRYSAQAHNPDWSNYGSAVTLEGNRCINLSMTVPQGGSVTVSHISGSPSNPEPSEAAIISPAIGATISGSAAYIKWTGDTHTKYRVRVNSVDNPDAGIVWDSGEVTSGVFAALTGTLAPANKYFIYVSQGNSGGWSDWSSPGRWFRVGQTLQAKAAGTITIDGATSDWNLSQFTTPVRGGQSGTGDYALVGYDGGVLYCGAYAGVVPQNAADHTAKVYSRTDSTYQYFLVRCDDNDIQYGNPTSANWANDCVEFYLDPAHTHGSVSISSGGATSDCQLVIDANNQKNVYCTTAGYATQILNGVTSAVVRDATGWWLEARITKSVLDPDLPANGTIGVDFNFRDNDNNNDANLTTVYTWSDNSTGSFPSKIPDKWGDLTVGTATPAVNTINVKTAGAITIDGATSDWTLSDFTTKSRGGQKTTGDYALVGYDSGTCYYGSYYGVLPTSASDHTAKVYSRHDGVYQYFLVRCDDSDMRYNNPTSANWANDCVEFYFDPSNSGGANALDGSASNLQLVIDANNQKNVYGTTSSYATQILNGVTSAVVRDGTGWWLEARIAKTAFDPDLSESTFGVDFNFRDNDNNNDPAQTTCYTWSDASGIVFPSKIPDNWGDAIPTTLSQSAYSGTISIPGTIQAENYDTGGQGVAYNDTTAGNTGGQYRSDDVDIATTTDTGGGYCVGWMDVGEWLEYSINVASSGDYDINTRAASGASGGSFRILVDGVDVTGLKSMAGTGDWQNWTTITAPARYLTSGNHTLRFLLEAGQINLNYINISSVGADAVSVDLGSPDVIDGVTNLQSGDGDTTPWTAAGHNFRENVDYPDVYMYFGVSDAWAYQGSKQDVYVECSYYDVGTGTLSLQYDATGNAYQSVTGPTLGNTLTYKTYTWHVTDAYFGNRQNAGADFRFCISSQQEWGIDTVTVYQGAPDTTPPGNVTSFTATSGDMQNGLSWNNPGDSDFAGVKIMYKTTGYPTSTTDGTQCYSGTGTSTTHTSLTNGILYYYKAFSFDGVPNYSSGSQASATPADVTPPGNVSSFTATAGNAQNSLSWANPGDSDLAGVKIMFKTTGYPTSISDGTQCFNSTGTSYNHTGLTNGVTYYYKAFSYDEVPNYSGGATAIGTPNGVSVLTINTKSAANVNLVIDGNSSDWNLASNFTTKARGGQVEAGDYAIVGYDSGTCYYGSYAPGTVLPTNAADHTAKVYNYHDQQYLFFLVRCDDDDMQYGNSSASNWANDCIEFYIDPSHAHGSTAISNSTSDIQLVIDANNQKNVYCTTSGYATQVLNGVTSAVVRDGTGWWLECKILKSALDPDVANSGSFGVDFNFRDNDNNNNASLTSVYAWRESSTSGYPSKIPDHWGDASLATLSADTTAPAAVTSFTATGGTGQVSLSWTNPSTADYTGTMVRYKTGGYPTSTSDGTQIYNGTGTSYNHTSLAAGTTYYYSAWSYDDANNYASAAQASATTSSGPVTISNSTFDSDANGWTVTTWRLSTAYGYGTMAWTSGVGNGGGGMRSTGTGSTDSTDRCTREGGEISKTISTSGYSNIKVSYDLHVNSLGGNYTGAGSGSCTDDHSLIDEQLTVYYSTNGGSSWTEAEYLTRGTLLSSYQSYGTRTIDLTGVSACNNNANFAVRFRWQLNTTSDTADLDNIKITSN